MEKNLDQKGRWRHTTVAFRVSEEEAKMIDTQVKLSGLTKQDYIVKRLLQKDIVVQGVYTDQTVHTARWFSAWLPPIQCTLSGQQCIIIQVPLFLPILAVIQGVLPG